VRNVEANAHGVFYWLAEARTAVSDLDGSPEVYRVDQTHWSVVLAAGFGTTPEPSIADGVIVAHTTQKEKTAFRTLTKSVNAHAEI
jgi:hypothetical protein